MLIQLSSLYQGFLVGLLVSIPLGPNGIFTMKRTADHGISAGVIAGTAIALIDTIFATILLFGIHLPHHQYRHIPHYVSIVGSFIIFWYGFSMFRRKEIKTPEKISRWQYHFLDTIWLSLTNPSTYFSFGGIALLLSPFLIRNNEARIFGAIGFFIGVFTWWMILVSIAHKKRDTYFKSARIQKIMGIVVMILAVWTGIYTFIPHNQPRRIDTFLKKI
ncbi:MAG: LysE family transporter [bacterium]